MAKIILCKQSITSPSDDPHAGWKSERRTLLSPRTLERLFCQTCITSLNIYICFECIWRTRLYIILKHYHISQRKLQCISIYSTTEEYGPQWSITLTSYNLIEIKREVKEDSAVAGKKEGGGNMFHIKFYRIFIKHINLRHHKVLTEYI